jgi:hypothetical protein
MCVCVCVCVYARARACKPASLNLKYILGSVPCRQRSTAEICRREDCVIIACTLYVQIVGF